MTDLVSTPDPSPMPREFAAGGVVLTLTPGQVYVEFAETQSSEEIEALLARYQLVSLREPYAESPEEGTLLRRGWLQSAADEDFARVIAELRANDGVRIAGPVYHRADLLPAVTGFSFADRLLVRFDPRATDEEVATFVTALGAEVVASAPDPREGPLHQVRLLSPKDQGVLAVCGRVRPVPAGALRRPRLDSTPSRH
jgi:hypothetical protein